MKNTGKIKILTIWEFFFSWWIVLLDQKWFRHFLGALILLWFRELCCDCDLENSSANTITFSKTVPTPHLQSLNFSAPTRIVVLKNVCDSLDDGEIAVRASQQKVCRLRVQPLPFYPDLIFRHRKAQWIGQQVGTIRSSTDGHFASNQGGLGCRNKIDYKLNKILQKAKT